jgi:hypothetical protein
VKKILILVLSADFPPYDKMVQTSLETWDSIDQEGCETVYYFGKSNKPNTDKFVYLPINESLFSMGRKTLMAFEWALQNKEFDYIARPHSCIYVNKKELVNCVNILPSENVFSGLKVEDKKPWLWGGCGYVFSKDVVYKIVGNKKLLDVKKMEDMAISHLASDLDIPYTQGIGCSIDRLKDKWRCTCYGTESFEFYDFHEVAKNKNQYFYRVKQDLKRDVDEYVMKQLFKALNSPND